MNEHRKPEIKQSETKQNISTAKRKSPTCRSGSSQHGLAVLQSPTGSSENLYKRRANQETAEHQWKLWDDLHMELQDNKHITDHKEREINHIFLIVTRWWLWKPFWVFIHKHLPFENSTVFQETMLSYSWLKNTKIIMAWSFKGEIKYILVTNDSKRKKKVSSFPCNTAGCRQQSRNILTLICSLLRDPKCKLLHINMWEELIFVEFRWH